MQINNIRRGIDHLLRLPVKPFPGAGESADQAGVLAYRAAPQGHDVLLITSRRSGRWILPKGWPGAGESLVRSAVREAYEEAGVIGTIEPVELGRFVANKIRGSSCSTLVVAVYPFQVELELADWPERRDRRRMWFSLAQARTILAAEQRGMLRALERWLRFDLDKVAGGAKRGAA